MSVQSDAGKQTGNAPYWRALLWVAVGVGVALRAFHVGHFSLWYDEIYTMQVIDPELPWGNIWALLQRDLSAPFYYYVLRAYVEVFGYTDVSVRLFSVVASWAGFGLLVGALHRLGGVQLAATVTVLAAGQFLLLRYAAEVRFYALLTAQIGVVLWVWVGHVRKPTWRTTLGLVLGSALLLYTHYHALFLLAGAGLYAAVCVLKSSVRRQPVPQVWLLGGVGLLGGLLAFVPWLPVLLYQQAHYLEYWPAWRQLPPPAELAGIFWKVSGGHHLELLVGALALGWLALKRPFRGQQVHQRVLGFALAAAAGGWLLPFVLSYLLEPMFEPRYFVMWVPVALVPVAMGLSTLPFRWLRWLLPAYLALTLLFLLGIPKYFSTREQRDSFKAAVPQLEQLRGTTPVYCSYPASYNYYARQNGFPPTCRSTADTTFPACTPPATGPQAFWLVVHRYYVEDSQRLARVKPCYTVTDSLAYPHLTLYRYQRLPD